MVKGYSKFLNGLEDVEKAFLIITGAVMVLVVFYQIILRYIFNNANSWSDELARYLFIYDVLIGASIATRRGSHLQIDFLINMFKPKTKCWFTICSTLIGIICLVFLFLYSLTLIEKAAANISPGLNIPMSIPYTCIPIGVVLMLLTSIEVIIKNIKIIKGIGKEEVSNK